MAYTPIQKQQMIANHMKRHHPHMASTNPRYIVWNSINNNSTVASNNIYTVPSSTTNGQTMAGYISANRVRNYATYPEDNGKVKIQDGIECEITLPDGTLVKVEKDGSFRIDDKDAKVVYRANRMRDFNPFINASDKLEDFIKYCGTLNVKQDEMLQLPLELFIMWLVLEAAKADQMEEPEQPLIASIKNTTKARCTACGRFMRKVLKQKSVNQCSPKCFEIACVRMLC